MRTISAAVLLATVLVFVTACAAATRDTTDDPTISTRVKIALLDDPATELLRLDVRTFQGVVTLSGAVPSAAIGQRAEAVARTIGGVKDVKNETTVSPGGSHTIPECAC